MSVDRRVQVYVPGACAARLGASDGLRFAAPFAEGAPATTIGDTPGLLHIEVHHVPGMLGYDLAHLAVVLPVRVDESPLVQAELVEVSRDRTAADRDVFCHQLEGDPCSRPFPVPAHCLDLGDGLTGCRSRLVDRRG